MRYFKYDNVDDSFNNALKEQYKTLTQDEKRTFRKLKRFRRFASTVMLLVCVGLVTLSVLLLRAIPEPDSWFFGILAIVGEVVGGFYLVDHQLLFSSCNNKPIVEKGRVPSYSNNEQGNFFKGLPSFKGLLRTERALRCNKVL